MLKSTTLPCWFALILLLPVAPSVSDAAEIVELRYTGTLTSHPRGKEAEPVKTFHVMLLSERDNQEQNGEFWRTDENGSGRHWPESFGRIHPAETDAKQTRHPSLLFEHDRLPWPIPLPPLSLEASKLQAGKSWTVDRLKYEVAERDQSDPENPVVRVAVTSNFGRAQTLKYDPLTGHLIDGDVKLFLGRGDEFSLKITRTDTNDISEAVSEKVQQAQQILIQMQQDLKRSEDAVRPEFSDQQLDTINSLLPELDKLTQNTPLQSLTIAIHRDLKSQQERTENIEQLASKYLGRPAPELDLTLLDESALPRDDLKDKVIVLHFWKYHDDPLQEPYGQVGYLDFLHGKRGKLGVKFLGVAVDPKFANPDNSRSVMLAVKKLVSFMNLGYDILRDDGSLLEKFGDPQSVGAKLPLWVVIGADGKITHYKAGYYEVNPREGLKELDAAIVKAIKDRRAASQD